MSALLSRLRAALPRGRRAGAAIVSLTLVGGVATVIAPAAAHAATTPVTVTVAGSSYYGGTPAFGATTNVSGVTVTGVTCTTTTTGATISAALPAGNYTIKAASCSGGTLSDPNYSIGSYSGSFYLVYKVGITVTANDASRSYGAANPAFTYSATGWVNGDTSALLSGTPAYSTTATSTSDIGTYPISIAQGTLRSSSPNYYFAAFNPGTLTVGATPLTVTVAGSSFYGSAPVFGATTSVSGVTVTGVTCTGTTSSATLSSTTTAGSYTIDPTTCSGGTLSNPDYSIGSYKGSFYLVYKDPISVTADDKSRSYGAANPAFTYQLSGFVNGEDASVVTGAASLTTTATASSDTGTYPITAALGTLKAANYYFTFTPGTLTVGAAPVTVTVAGASTYGGAPVFGATTPVNGLTVSGVTCTAATDSSVFGTALAAGTYSIDASTCSGAVLSNPNFTVAGYKGSFYIVYKAPLTVTANDASRAYGAANPAFGYTVAGFVNSDTASVITGSPSYSTTATSTSDTGTYPITPAVGTLKAANYYFTFTPGTLTVTSAPVTVTVAGAQFYGGTPAFGATTTVNGLTVTGVTCTATTTAASFSPTLGAGNYTVDGSTCTGGVLSNPDYTISGYTGSFYIVYKAPLAVTASDMNRAYGHNNPAFAYTVTGFVNGETSAVISGAPAITSTATATSDIGTYPITPTAGTLKASNYYFTFTSGTLTVNPVPVAVTVAGAQSYGGSAAFRGTTTVSGLTVTGATCTGTTSGATITPSLTAGNYTLDATTCSGAVLSSIDYTISGYTGSFYIVTRPVLVVTPTSTSRTYGDANPTFAYTITGFVNGDTVSVVSGTPAITSTATPASAVGTYPVSASLGTLSATNYSFAFASGSTLTVTPATLTITAQNVSRAYGDVDPTIPFSVTGFRNGDPNSVVSGAPGFTSTATITSDPGQYTVTPTLGTLAAQNYTFAFVPAQLTIVKATVTMVTSSALTQPMTATVTYDAGKFFLVGATINFYLGKTATLLCSAVTDSNGFASCKAPGLQGANVILQGYTAEYDGSIDFNAASQLQH